MYYLDDRLWRFAAVEVYPAPFVQPAIQFDTASVPTTFPLGAF